MIAWVGMEPIEETIISILTAGDIASIPGFGEFERTFHEGLSAKNPRTGQIIKVEPKVVIWFDLDEALRNPDPTAPKPELALGNVEQRLAGQLAISSEEAEERMLAWALPKITEILKATIQQREERSVDLGALGELNVSIRNGEMTIDPSTGKPAFGALVRSCVLMPSKAMMALPSV